MFRLYVEVFVVLRRILPEFETFFTRCSLGFINDNNIAIQPHRNLSIFLVIYIWKGHGQYIQAKISVFYFGNILKICVLKLPRLLKLITCDSIAFFFWSICLAISITRVQTQGPGQLLTGYDKVSGAMVILLNTRRTRGRCELNSVTLWVSWPRSDEYRTSFIFFHFSFLCITIQNLPECSTIALTWHIL